MQVIVTSSAGARCRTFNIPSWRMVGLVAAGLVALLALSGTVYHFLLLKAAREGWPIVSRLAAPLAHEDTVQRDRFLRDNLDAMASKVGEMQARLVQLDSMSERVSGLAGLKDDELRALQQPPAAASAATSVENARTPGGRGGPYVPVSTPSLDQLNSTVASLEAHADRGSDVWILIESRLLEARLGSLMVPSSAPIDGPVGSGFGVRLDPFTGRNALHTGLDFPAEVGTAIDAAAGGVVLRAETHPQYGRMVELDHGNGLVTRYAHASKLLVKPGDLVRRGQAIARVGSTGRSTGAHLHFEVLVDGSPQDPAKFLARTAAPTATAGLGAAVGRAAVLAQ